MPATPIARRALTGAGASLLLVAAAAGAAKADECDRDLLAACAEFQRHESRLTDLNRRLMAMTSADPSHDAAWPDLEAHSEAWWAAVAAVTDLPPRTPEGLRAKAAVAVAVLRHAVETGPQDVFDDCADKSERLWMAVISDVAGRA